MMRSLYPSNEPNAVYKICVDKIHELYVEECGNTQGVPVVFLHGGPGSGCSDYHRRFFDPDFYRIILFDQRGSGKGFYPEFTDTSKKADNGRGGVSCRNAENTQRNTKEKLWP